jgi:hypothetical protein
MGADLRLFGDDRTVDVIDDRALGLEQFDRVPKEKIGGRSFPLQVRGREMLADIPKASCAQQSIGNRVEDNVGVAVPGQPARMWHYDAAEHDGAFAGEGMDVEAHTRARRKAAG